VARICARTASASAVAKDGSQVLASPMAWGKIVDPRAMTPEQISSCTIAGTPSRVEEIRWRWMAFASVAASRAARLLAPEIRVTWPSPWRSRSGPAGSSRGPSASWKTHALPSWATFSSRLIRASRSATRSPIPREGSR
jgi:hypothetical protein